MTAPPIRVVWQEATIEDVVRHWIKDYDVPVETHEWFFDPVKGKFVFKLYVTP